MAGKVYLSTIGAKFGYAFETVSGTRPTGAYTEIEGVKSTPDMNPEPDTIETTTLNNTEFKTYINGLKDLGGALGFNFGMYDGFVDEWNTMVETADANAETQLNCWFTIWVPGMSKSIYFTGRPSKIGMSAMEVNSSFDVTVNVVPTGEPVWETAIEPTPASE